MNDEIEMLQEMVEQHGDSVASRTKVCVLWKMEHPNCFGCSSELGCCKVLKLVHVMTIYSMYEPKSFDDFEKMHQRITKLNKLILNTRTIEELNAIDF